MNISINGKEYPLRFNMVAMEMIEASFDGIDGMYAALSDKKRTIWSIIELITIFVSAGKAEKGERPVKHEWVASSIKPYQLEGLQGMIAEVINDGMKPKMDELDDEEHDEVLEEIQKKTVGQ